MRRKIGFQLDGPVNIKIFICDSNFENVWGNGSFLVKIQMSKTDLGKIKNLKRFGIQ